MTSKTLIIGGGLSGLALADMLERAQQDYLLLEARARFGGRIKTTRTDGASFDMGPAWFWPGQPRIAALTNRLGLEKFDQYARGDLVFEDARGEVQHGRGFSSMEGSWRLAGGLTTLTNALAGTLPQGQKRLNAQVTGLSTAQGRITASLASGEALTADRAVLALPPRVAAQITFTPALPRQTLLTLQNIPTWMAGHAKAVAVYDTPFWREAGLSGDASSQRGPLVEIHDASPSAGGPYALFGFIGVPPRHRTDKDILRQQVEAQLVRLFGDAAATPIALHFKDWAFDPFTATTADQAPLYAHPTYAPPPALTAPWDATLHFAGTEFAPQFGGYLEGALAAAENAFSALIG